MSQTDKNGEPFDIGDEIRAICSKLGIDYGATASIEIKPGLLTASADVWRRNEDGLFFNEKGEPARDLHVFKIKS